MGVVPSSALGIVINNPGKVADFYKMESKPLGEGSFGAVFYGTLRVTKASRAIKRIAKEKMREKLVTLKTEVQLLKLVDHPHIVMLHEIFEDNEDVHLVMSLCRGGHLQAYVMRYGRLKEQPAVAAMRQLFRAVAYLHRHFICHRDLKSENLMLLHDEPFTGSSRNTLKVTDFGLAALFQPGVPLTSTAGTPSHMAPEVYAKRYNLACDLWSCGVILFFVVSRLMPFDVNDKGSKRFKFNLNVHPWDLIHQDCINLVTLLLERSVHKRATAAAALHHQWIVNNSPRVEEVAMPSNVLARLKRYRKHNRFKQACFSVAASFLKECERSTSDSLFHFLDTTGAGRITIEEMARLVGDDDARDIFGPPDPVDNTYKPFAYTEFLAATFDRKQALTTAVCKTAFAAFDRNGDGSISMAELTSGHLLGQLSVEELSLTLKQLDKNGDQAIDFQEFMAIVKDEGD
ncbi:CPK2 [Symbiodinium natans]|uniref:non-specific serine/threonine protein kinase n=1 Tax=Symbiodinium natans TaxID=878477 RepID=A0A812IHW0_9DINO|nr:CPK2 [Symbiodinium natans]